MDTIKLGFSPCPNDTFLFYALSSGKIPSKINIESHIMDVQKLNRLAQKRVLDVTKLSLFAYSKVAQDYVILRSGAALGYGYGPLLIGRKPQMPDKNDRVAIPGKLTTAHLLFKTFFDNVKTVPYVFHEIMPALFKKEIDYGIIINEGRFTYHNYGFSLLADLGKLWQEKFDLPIPLGVIAAKRSLGEKIFTLEKKIRQSLAYAYERPQEVASYVKSHAQEMEEDAIASHIRLYVNKNTERLDKEGKKAILFFLEKARTIMGSKFTPDLPLIYSRKIISD